MAKGSEIEVCESDVYDMNGQQLDSYMDWYQKIWVKEPFPGSKDTVNEEILDMFPLKRLDQIVEEEGTRRNYEPKNTGDHRITQFPTTNHR